MFGTNPKRAPMKGDGQMLAVQEIFPTFQGEGPLAGRASVFIRLGGCNLACSFCDTEFENFTMMPLDQLEQEVSRLSAPIERPLMVITGGEPLRQPIAPLCDRLLARGYDVQIETNGTLFQEIDPRVTMVCSPKAAAGFYAPLRPDMLVRADALKFVISKDQAPYDAVPDVGQLAHKIPVYLQPMDAYDVAKNAANMAHTIALARTHGLLLSMQLHKMVGAA